MKVFKLNDCDWYMAPTLDEAKQAAAHDWGYSLEDAEREELFDDAHEVSDEAMERLMFNDDPGVPDAPRRTFREELQRRVAGGVVQAESFASTEY